GDDLLIGGVAYHLRDRGKKLRLATPLFNEVSKTLRRSGSVVLWRTQGREHDIDRNFSFYFRHRFRRQRSNGLSIIDTADHWHVTDLQRHCIPHRAEGAPGPVQGLFTTETRRKTILRGCTG